MPGPIEIRRPRLLLVEGPDAFHFFCNFLERMKIEDVQVASFGGVDELPVWLRLLQNAPGFAGKVNAIGVVRDAEADATLAFKAVCRALSSCGLEPPVEVGGRSASNPAVSVFILPDGVEPGMLETLCLRAVASDPAASCVEGYLACLVTHGIPARRPTKSRFFAFLASRDEPGKPHGVALKAGYLNYDSPAYDALKAFIQAL